MNLQTKDITGSLPGPHLLITGGIHGDEFEPMAAIRRLMLHVTPDSLRGQLTLIPVVNEPAFARCHRTAEDGLDLARTFPGRHDGSLSERIAWALSERIRAATHYIDLHSGGIALDVFPLVGYMLHPRPNVLNEQRRMAKAFHQPIIWGTDPQLQGRSLSVARDADVPAIYAEYHGSGLCDPQGVTAYVEGCLNVMAVLGMIDRAVPTFQPLHVVEDSRPGSGHMQACYPAPHSGFFEAAVRPGETVAIGQPLGTIRDVLGQQTSVVPALQPGIVLVLRTFSRVAQGESLAVILETERNADAQQ